MNDYLGLEKTQVIGLIGAILLIIGCFTPLISLTFIATLSISLLGNGVTPYGIILIATAGVSIILIFFKFSKWLYATGAAALVVILYFFLNILSIQSQIKDISLFGELASAMIRLDYGWLFLISGAILIIISPYLEKKLGLTTSKSTLKIGDYDKLEKLANLKSIGAITEEEFNYQKGIILNSSSQTSSVQDKRTTSTIFSSSNPTLIPVSLIVLIVGLGILALIFITPASSPFSSLGPSEQSTTNLHGIMPTLTQSQSIFPNSVSTTSSIEPIIGLWTEELALSNVIYTFNPDGQYIENHSNIDIDSTGTWSKVRENEYSVLYSNIDGKTSFTYHPITDTLIEPKYPNYVIYRSGKSPRTTTTRLSSSLKTAAVNLVRIESIEDSRNKYNWLVFKGIMVNDDSKSHSVSAYIDLYDENNVRYDHLLIFENVGAYSKSAFEKTSTKSEDYNYTTYDWYIDHVY